jgi:hypothetical protein
VRERERERKGESERELRGERENEGTVREIRGFDKKNKRKYFLLMYYMFL